ncbi:MAG: hypothetical protein ACC742_16295 [Thermoanaerobaculales bacterium]
MPARSRVAAYCSRAGWIAAHFLLLDLGSTAVAAVVVFPGNNFDVVITPEGNVGTTPLKALRISVQGKNGSLPNTFDSTKGDHPGPFPGISTVGNGLHQVWEFGGVVMTPTHDLAGDPNGLPQEIDSHFLVDTSPNGDVQTLRSPDEDMVLGSIEDPRAGFGSFLRGTFFLRVGYEAPTWDLAYVVVPPETQLLLDFDLAGTAGEGDEVIASYQVRMGDMDCDGRVDFDDIEPLAAAFRSETLYMAEYGFWPVVYGDVEGDGDFDFDDVPFFVDLLLGSTSGAALVVPEPPLAVPLVAAWAAFLLRFRRSARRRKARGRGR